MSLSTRVALLRSDKDPKYQQYLKIFRACQEAKISPPEEVDEYFGGDENAPLEIEYDAPEIVPGAERGYEITLANLPEGVKKIRFEIF